MLLQRTKAVRPRMRRGRRGRMGSDPLRTRSPHMGLEARGLTPRTAVQPELMRRKTSVSGCRMPDGSAPDRSGAMATTDKLFAGSIPEVYDQLLVPLIFESHARDLAERLAKVEPQDVLETAAGTGVLTRA